MSLFSTYFFLASQRIFVCDLIHQSGFYDNHLLVIHILCMLHCLHSTFLNERLATSAKGRKHNVECFSKRWPPPFQDLTILIQTGSTNATMQETFAGVNGTFSIILPIILWTNQILLAVCSYSLILKHSNFQECSRLTWIANVSVLSVKRVRF